MSRSGYSDDCDGWELIRWRGAVESAIRGARGQAFLRELLTALDEMPHKRLVAHDLQRPDGEVCALGSVGARRGIAMEKLDPYDAAGIATTLGIARALVKEIEFLNDDIGGDSEEPSERRWSWMRQWVASQIKSLK